MNQKGFANIILVIFGVVVLAGIAGYFIMNQRTQAPEVIPSPTPSSTSTPTPTPIQTPTASPTPVPNPTPTPTTKLDPRSSLLTITKLHLKDASTIVAGAKLFETETFISPEEINTGNIRIHSVFSSFVLPNEDIKYISVEEWFDNPAKRNYATSSKSFIVQVCSGGAPPPPEFHCGEPTGESEPREEHLPVANWIIDSKDLAKILKEKGMGSSRGGKIVVATVGRLKSHSEFPLKSITQFPDGRAVIEFIETASGTSSNLGGRYVILDAMDGKVLESGTYTLPPPEA